MENFKLTEEGKSKINKLPLSMRFLAKYLLEVLNHLINGDCSEEQVLSSVGTLKQNSEGRINNNDVLNYDKACEFLGISVTNRVRLKKILDKNGIHQVIINNQRCGFLRSDLSALKDKLNKDIRKRNKVS